MKQITEYLLSKNKPTVDDLLDKKYKNVNELVDDLNIYFEDKLKKPIKVVKTDVVFKPMSEFTKDGIHVKDHFVIEFTDIKTKLRFGNFNGELMMQEVFRSWNNRIDYGQITRYNAYKYGENFLEWLNKLKADKKCLAALKIFGIYKD